MGASLGKVVIGEILTKSPSALTSHGRRPMGLILTVPQRCPKFVTCHQMGTFPPTLQMGSRKSTLCLLQERNYVSTV